MDLRKIGDKTQQSSCLEWLEDCFCVSSVGSSYFLQFASVPAAVSDSRTESQELCKWQRPSSPNPHVEGNDTIEIQLSYLKLTGHLLRTWMAAPSHIQGSGIIIAQPVGFILCNCFPVFSSHKVAA